MRGRAATLRLKPGHIQQTDNYGEVDPAVAAKLASPAPASEYLQVEGGMLYDESGAQMEAADLEI